MESENKNDTDDSKEVEGKDSKDPRFRFFPPNFACHGLEEQAELYAEAKQALLEQTGNFVDLESLIDDEAGVHNQRES